jgi:hypothetical protein
MKRVYARAWKNPMFDPPTRYEPVADLDDTQFLDCVALITAEARARDGPPSWDSKVLEPPDHRLGRRKPITRKVGMAVRVGMSGLGRDLGCGLVDVTDDGLGIKLKEPIQAGREVTIDLALPGVSKPLRVIGEVRWCRAAGDGTFTAGVRLRRRLPYPTMTDLAR